tara:strand:+ start:20376 stop:22172 length:1797 start_codon:yes stop_codon:yes gene_type:complete
MITTSKKTILGISVSHNASACLMHEGEVIACLQEERFINKKNFFGYPKKSIDFCLDIARQRKLNIDKAIFTSKKRYIYDLKYPIGHFYSIKDFHDHYGKKFYERKIKNLSTKKYYTQLKNDKRNQENLYLSLKNIPNKHDFNLKKARELQTNFLIKQSKGEINNVEFFDHHSCHIAYAYFSSRKRLKNSAIITIDSQGDGLNQTVWICDRNKKIRKISESSECDIARTYKLTTLLLKMKPDEHEYKVMGLAPYSKNEYSRKVYERVYKNLLQVKGSKIVHKNRPKDLYKYLIKSTSGERFDNIAGGVQIFVEELVAKLFLNIYKKYKVKNFYLSGGVSMNIKMNKMIKDLPYVDNFFVQPSGGDESLAMGGCYLEEKFNSKPFKNIYLGRDIFHNFTEKKFLNYIKNKKNLKLKLNFSPKKAARLLSKGEVLAVARGREEFGARALGNRSILADPSNVKIIQKINELIKNRDFWMPFALTILDEKHKTFLVNKKNINSEHMTIGFDTVEKKHSLIEAGTHRYDKSVRPQILIKKSNHNFHNLIIEFYKLKKIPALLNTSLNLHGFPIASTIKEVLYTFENSDLKYLYINDKFLIKKIN